MAQKAAPPPLCRCSLGGVRMNQYVDPLPHSWHNACPRTLLSRTQEALAIYVELDTRLQADAADSLSKCDKVWRQLQVRKALARYKGHLRHLAALTCAMVPIPAEARALVSVFGAPEAGSNVAALQVWVDHRLRNTHREECPDDWNDYINALVSLLLDMTEPSDWGSFDHLW